MKKYCIPALSILTILLTACGSTPTSIEDEWEKNIGKLGVAPVYPPREDFYVGNVFLCLPTNAASSVICQNGNNGGDVKVKNMNLFSTLGLGIGRQYLPAKDDSGKQTVTGIPDDSDEIPWPAMEKYSPTQNNFIWTEPPPAKAETLERNPRRLLKLVSFPAFTLASGTLASLGLNAPSGSLGAMLGTGYSKNTNISVSVPAAESYGWPLLAQIKILKNKCVNEQWKDTLSGIGGFADELPLTIVTEVFYARVINVDLSFSSAAGVDVGIVPQYFSSLSQKQQDLEKQSAQLMTDPTAKDANGVSNKDKADQINQQIQDIQSKMANAVPSVPGVKGAIVHVSSTGVTLQSALEYPVAIGFRGVNVNLDWKGCEIKSLSSSTGPLIRGADIEVEGKSQK